MPNIDYRNKPDNENNIKSAFRLQNKSESNHKNDSMLKPGNGNIIKKRTLEAKQPQRCKIGGRLFR